jgi:hypothetical protein
VKCPTYGVPLELVSIVDPDPDPASLHVLHVAQNNIQFGTLSVGLIQSYVCV